MKIYGGTYGNDISATSARGSSEPLLFALTHEELFICYCLAQLVHMCSSVSIQYSSVSVGKHADSYVLIVVHMLLLGTVGTYVF